VYSFSSEREVRGTHLLIWTICSVAISPAAVIGLSEAAKVAQALPMSANADKLDLDLVQEIRQRIADGTFEIDYQQVAGNLLGNAVAAVRAGRG
jgi:hypothetical protein